MILCRAAAATKEHPKGAEKNDSLKFMGSSLRCIGLAVAWANEDSGASGKRRPFPPRSSGSPEKDDAMANASGTPVQPAVDRCREQRCKPDIPAFRSFLRFSVPPVHVPSSVSVRPLVQLASHGTQSVAVTDEARFSRSRMLEGPSALVPTTAPFPVRSRYTRPLADTSGRAAPAPKFSPTVVAG